MTHDPNNKGMHVPTPCPECRSLVGHNYNCSRLNKPADEVEKRIRMQLDGRPKSPERLYEFIAVLLERIDTLRAELEAVKADLGAMTRSNHSCGKADPAGYCAGCYAEQILVNLEQKQNKAK